MIVLIAVGSLLGMPAIGQTQTFRKAAYHAPELMILVQAPVKTDVVAQSLNDAASLLENIAELAINRETNPVANKLPAIDGGWLGLPRFRGQAGSWDQGIWSDRILSSSLG